MRCCCCCLLCTCQYPSALPATVTIKHTRCFFFCLRLSTSSFPLSLFPAFNVIAGALANALPSFPKTTSCLLSGADEEDEAVDGPGWRVSMNTASAVYVVLGAAFALGCRIRGANLRAADVFSAFRGCVGALADGLALAPGRAASERSARHMIYTGRRTLTKNLQGFCLRIIRVALRQLFVVSDREFYSPIKRHSGG